VREGRAGRSHEGPPDERGRRVERATGKPTPEVAHSTVLTMLRSLREKGWVEAEEEGRAYRFYPTVPVSYARWWALNRITDVEFGGSREALLTELLDDQSVGATVLRRRRRLIDERLDTLAAR